MGDVRRRNCVSNILFGSTRFRGWNLCIFGVIDDATISEIVGLPDAETVAAIITYGFEEGNHAAPTQRHSVEEIMRVAGE